MNLVRQVLIKTKTVSIFLNDPVKEMNWFYFLISHGKATCLEEKTEFKPSLAGQQCLTIENKEKHKLHLLKDTFLENQLKETNIHFFHLSL